MGVKFQCCWPGVLSTSTGLDLTVSSAAAGTSLGQVMDSSLPQSPHLYNGNKNGGNKSTQYWEAI